MRWLSVVAASRSKLVTSNSRTTSDIALALD